MPKVQPSQTSTRFKNELKGIGWIALAILTFLIILEKSAAQIGLLGIYMRKFLFSLFGEGVWFFPFFLFYIGFYRLFYWAQAAWQKRLTGAGLVLLSVLAYLHMDIPAEGFFAYASGGLGGGLLGAAFSWILLKLFGKAGSYVIIISLFLTGVLIISEVSASSGLRWLYSRTKEVLTGIMTRLVSSRQKPREEGKARTRTSTKVKSAEKEQVLVRTEVVSNPPEPIITAEIDTDSKRAESAALPDIELLRAPANSNFTLSEDEINKNIALLEQTLDNFGVKAKVQQVSVGPTITRYEIQPAPGIKVSRIVNLADDIALSLAAAQVRIEAPIPGKAAVGIEVPNKTPAPVFLKEVIESPQFKNSPSPLTVALGKDIAGQPVVADLIKMPHLLVAGSTGSGKSVCINSLITSILYKSGAETVKFMLIDPKMVELSIYNGIPHLLAPVVTDPKKAAGALRWAVMEMEKRYTSFAEAKVKNIEGYNNWLQKQNQKPLPYIVVIIDELADLMMVAPADVEDAICRLAQMARAAGIHLVIATQRPSVDVITGLIKANVPSRIAFAVSSQIDSRTILDMAGAEKLLGRGDMLYYPIGANKPIRVQGAYIGEEEIELIVSHLKTLGAPIFNEEVINLPEDTTAGPENIDDDLLPQAVRVVVEHGQASASLLQRRLRVGYARAARLVDLLEQIGVVGPHEGSKPRTVLLSKEQLDNFLDSLKK
ncbi:DNA translocase FtsK [Carboxydocella thermautotrophica]|nr:DNA translocase FtsK [Carboxydocella thermautotrophica]